MNTRQYLTFSLHNLHYGIEATLVQEVLPLPELTLLEEIEERETNLIGIIICGDKLYQ
jgi:purine-binding chemotaxis protein CheW